MSPDERHLPGFIIAGTNKAGTSSMWNYLARHPEVSPSAIKETGYWSPLRYSNEDLQPLSVYCEQWPKLDPSLLRMEATPAYFYGGRVVASAINNACPDVRIMILLRDPSARLSSFLRFEQSMLRLPTELTLKSYAERCLRKSSDELRRRDQDRWFGVAGGIYVDLLAEWYDVFGPRLHVAFFDDLIANPRDVVSSTCAWLDINVDVAEKLPLEAKNLTVAYRNKTLQGIALRVNDRNNRFLLRHPRLKSSVVSAYRKLNGVARSQTATIEDDAPVLAEFDAWYADHNRGLRALLERHNVTSIPSWVT